jgi:tyrosinase
MSDLKSLLRRDFLREMGYLGVGGVALWAGGCESCQQQIQSRPTRRNIQNLALTDPVITTYKNAVNIMKGMPASSPLSWEGQAQIHYRSCIHRNWLWLPWHRVYLVYLERIIRKLTGDNAFALPYWNWTTHPAVPDAFWQAGSSLNDPNRGGLTSGDTADPSYIGASVVQNILDQPSFELFASGPPTSSNLHNGSFSPTGMLEGSPHNNIHIFCSGPLGTGDMGPFTSPRDPIFYTHHNMLDCLWTHWNIDLANANTNDPAWTNFQINDFFDENGNPTSVTAATTVLYPILTYQFEPCSLVPSSPRKLTGKDLETFLKAGAPSKLEFTQRFEVRRQISAEVGKPYTATIDVQPAALANALQGGRNTRIVLTIGDAQIPDKRDFFVRIFINKPDANGFTPIDDPHYAGSFGFFFDKTGMQANEGHAEMKAASMDAATVTGFLVDVTNTLQKLNQGGSLSSPRVDVSLVPVPYTYAQPTRPPEGHLSLGRLELAVARF